MQLQVSTDGKINGRLSSIFLVPLDGVITSLSFLSFSKGDSFTVILSQDSTGSRTCTFPSGITWQSGQAPSLQTAANAKDVFQFTCTGTGTFTDTAGSSSRLPARLVAVGLATVAVIGTGSGMVGARFNLSQGGGQGIGNLPRAIEVRSNSGAQVNTVIDGSGSGLFGSGTVNVGTLNRKPASTVGSVVLKVYPSTKATNGTGAVILNGNKGGAVCIADTDGVGYTLCNANNGTQTCKVATSNECQ